MNSDQATLERLYDMYSPMLYSIAVEISPSSKEAESILIKVFHQIHVQKLAVHKSSLLGIALLKILLQTAQHELNSGERKSNIRLKCFQNAPLLHQIICEESGLKNYCEENNITTTEAMKQIRNEWSLLQSAETLTESSL